MTEANRPSGNGLSAEIRERLRAEITLPAADLARKYSVNVATIYNYRKKWGVPNPGSHRKPRAAAQRAIVIDSQAHAGIDGLLGGAGADVPGAAPIRVSLELDGRAASNLFDRLSPAHKQLALQAALQAMVGGGRCQRPSS
jgi:hypothetical protein